ncbi:MAG: aminopeptidase [Myxococcaceae bacterium]
MARSKSKHRRVQMKIKQKWKARLGRKADARKAAKKK